MRLNDEITSKNKRLSQRTRRCRFCHLRRRSRSFPMIPFISLWCFTAKNFLVLICCHFKQILVGSHPTTSCLPVTLFTAFHWSEFSSVRSKGPPKGRTAVYLIFLFCLVWTSVRDWPGRESEIFFYLKEIENKGPSALNQIEFWCTTSPIDGDGKKRLVFLLFCIILKTSNDLLKGENSALVKAPVNSLSVFVCFFEDCVVSVKD